MAGKPVFKPRDYAQKYGFDLNLPPPISPFESSINGTMSEFTDDLIDRMVHDETYMRGFWMVFKAYPKATIALRSFGRMPAALQSRFRTHFEEQVAQCRRRIRQFAVLAVFCMAFGLVWTFSIDRFNALLEIVRWLALPFAVTGSMALFGGWIVPIVYAIKKRKEIKVYKEYDLITANKGST